MISNEQAIIKAERERGDLIAECHSLIAAIGHKSSCLKLLGLARNHLKLLAGHKVNRRSRYQK